MSELQERLEEVKAISDDVRASENFAEWAASIDHDNYHRVSRHFKRSYEPAAVILEILDNSRSQIKTVFLTGGHEMKYDFCIIGKSGNSKRNEERALRGSDFYITDIRKGKKNRIVGAKLDIPKHGKIKVAFGRRYVNGLQEL